MENFKVQRPDSQSGRKTEFLGLRMKGKRDLVRRHQA